MLNFLMQEAQKLKDLKFDIEWKHSSIWVTFKSPILSKYLSRFLRRYGFTLQIDPATGLIEGTWMSGPYPKDEYNQLRDLFKEHLIELPEYGKIERG
ncbi:hypothetical protein A45J_2615 [hot springs metagenome]|uniref:Uncharacterized protein n=1 Tax=hot springs metagenome TaxID=433727 RepID=A0A5J4L9U9_9ZZZZ